MRDGMSSRTELKNTPFFSNVRSDEDLDLVRISPGEDSNSPIRSPDHMGILYVSGLSSLSRRGVYS